jgi:hypothetical protein
MEDSLSNLARVEEGFYAPTALCRAGARRRAINAPVRVRLKSARVVAR